MRTLVCWIRDLDRLLLLALGEHPTLELNALQAELAGVQIAFKLMAVHTLLPGSGASGAALVARYSYADRLRDLALRTQRHLDPMCHVAAVRDAGKLASIVDYQPPASAVAGTAAVCEACGTGELCADARRSDLRCNNPQCGQVQEMMVGAAAEDPAPDGGRSRSGQFDPNQHFGTWMGHIMTNCSDRVLGDSREGNAHGELLVASLRARMARNGTKPLDLTIVKVRALLKELGYSKHNENAALLLKVLSGRAPPTLSDEIVALVSSYFARVLEAFSDIHKSGAGGAGASKRKNKCYYPYYIYKILEQIVPVDDKEQRRILDYIYLQKQETIISNDQDWQKICKKIDLRYVPTRQFVLQT